MTVDEMVSILDDHGFGDTLTARKVEALNNRYHEICGEHPWPFLEATAAITTDANGKITTPAGSAIRAVIRVYLNRRISWMRRDELIDRYGASLTTAGEPHTFYTIANEVYLYPISQVTAQGTIDYLRIEADLAAGGAESTVAIPARYHRAIVYGALVDLYTMEDDPELAQAFELQYERKKERMYGDIMRRQYDRPDTVYMIDDGFGYDLDDRW